MDAEKWTPIHEFIAIAMEVGALLLILFAIVVLLAVIYMYISDVTQKKHTIRRNYPVVGRFRYFFEHMGEFFRQYFFAMDREELPFNRAQRSWAYRAAKNIDSTVAFGSTRPMDKTGGIVFLNDFFPTLAENADTPKVITIGQGYATTPYSTGALVNISGMSYGAISAPAVTALSLGAKKAGIWMNTGEGGLSRYHLEGGCDLVFQIGTAKYGVRDSLGHLSDEKLLELSSHPQLRMFEIKISQGAKPGKGGILPAAKVTAEISSIRSIPVGQDSISPNRHPEITDVDALLDMIVRIRTLTGKPCGFKTVIGGSNWIDELAVAIHRRGLGDAPDFITIDSADGGTGAAPQSLIDFVGLPLKVSLPLIIDKLTEYGLRERINVICSGKLINPSDVAWAMCMGADFVTSARGFMFALGCIQALQCNKNTCPTGIATHDPDLQKGLAPTTKSERVYHYAENMTYEVGLIANSCGVTEPRQLNRSHARIINDRGIPEPMDTLYPEAQVRLEYLKTAEQIPA